MISPLLTDLYQLTMAQGYHHAGRQQDYAVFHLAFRKLPFGGGYALAAGLEQALEFIEGFRFSEAELSYLAGLEAPLGGALFAPSFLQYLRELRLSVDIDAVPEGTVVFGHEPLLRVRGSLLEAQLLETTLLNLLNFQTLIATKAARVCQAARGDDVLEFGLRRAQGVDGALAASRAAYLGGCAATSNVLAGMQFGIPVRGTHAHSWVMSFDSEPEAFAAYADAMPDNCVLLVDTYDTLSGVRNAIDVGHALATRGKRLLGIRLDSGDLAWLSIEARKLLDAAGLDQVAILASNDLDEKLVESLKQQGAQISTWAVGTRMVTAYDQPALGGVYKLAAIAREGRALEPRIKLSDQPAKTSIPGVQQVRRFVRDGRFVADVIYDESQRTEPTVLVDPADPLRRRRLRTDLAHEDLLQPVVRSGVRVAAPVSLSQARARAAVQLEALDPTIRRLVHPHEYPVGLSHELFALRASLIEHARASERDV
jgi:nicotinate phosphoribosyltransferase